MKRIDVNQVTGKEILAKDICMSSGIIIIPSGSVIHTEYIPRLQELGIMSLLVVDDNPDEERLETNEQKIQSQCSMAVRTTLEKFSYCGNVELQEIARVAEDIMQDILTEPEVMYNVSRVREKSESTYSHSINVSALSVLIASKMKVPEHKLRDIAVGALLHDIGIVFVPFDLNHVKYQYLTEAQKKEIRKHVITGYSVIRKEKWISQSSKEIILSHHERLDGGGYPMRLKGDKLKLGTKIVAVCDEFDSHVYGNLASKQKVHLVIDYIMSQAGVKFDFKVVEAFISSVAAYPVGTNVLTNKGERAIVMRQNPKVPTRPVIRMLMDHDGKRYDEYIEKDLIEELTLFIVDTLDQ